MNMNAKYHEVLTKLIKLAESAKFNLDDAEIIIRSTKVSEHNQDEETTESLRAEVTIDSNGEAHLEEITYRVQVHVGKHLKHDDTVYIE